MKILLLGHGRCGSTSLQFGLADVMRLEKIIEPFNKSLWNNYYKTEPPYNKGDTLKDNIIFKTLTGPTFDNNWIKRNYTKFDKTIILMRGNLIDTLISHSNAITKGYLTSYSHDVPFTKRHLTHVMNNYQWLSDFYEKTITPHLVWYEDIYTEDFNKSKDTIRSLNLGLSDEQLNKLYQQYLNPKFRLRKN